MKDSLSSEPSKPSNAAHHRRQTMAADLRSRPMQAAGTATVGPVSGLPVHDDVNATPTHLLLLLSSHRTSAILKVRLHPFFLLMNEERAG